MLARGVMLPENNKLSRHREILQLETRTRVGKPVQIGAVFLLK